MPRPTDRTAAVSVMMQPVASATPRRSKSWITKASFGTSYGGGAGHLLAENRRQSFSFAS